MVRHPLPVVRERDLLCGASRIAAYAPLVTYAWRRGQRVIRH